MDPQSLCMGCMQPQTGCPCPRSKFSPVLYYVYDLIGYEGVRLFADYGDAASDRLASIILNTAGWPGQSKEATPLSATA